MNTIYKNRVPHKEKSFLGHLKCWLHGCVLFVKTLNCILKIYVFYSMQIHTSNLKKRKKKIYKKETQRAEQGSRLSICCLQGWAVPGEPLARPGPQQTHRWVSIQALALMGRWLHTSHFPSCSPSS